MLSGVLRRVTASTNFSQAIDANDRKRAEIDETYFEGYRFQRDTKTIRIFQDD